MDYAEYVSRRPPSPPPLSARDMPFTASPSLSSTLSSVSLPAARPSLSPAPDRPRRPPSPRSVSSFLHRRALHDEYAALAHLVRAATPAELLRHRQETVRIRLEDMLIRADPCAVRVLHLALNKCNLRLDALAAEERRVEDARARMRVIESKHFQGAHADTMVPQPLRDEHIRREAVATLVDHIHCTLHDQVRIHFLLTVLADKLALLRSHLHALDRADRPAPSDLHMHHYAAAHADPSQASSHSRSTFGQDGLKRAPFARRSSRSSLRNAADVDGPEYSQDRSTSRNNVLRTQRSLPRRADSRLIPFVVKRALSYNAAPRSPPDSPPPVPLNRPAGKKGADASWWGDTAPLAGGSEPHLALSDTRRSSGFSIATPPSPRRSDLVANYFQTRRSDDIDPMDEDSFPPMSPVSHVSRCTTASDVSRPTEARRRERTSAGESNFDQSVSVDVDSLCTEASSVLSSSQGIDAVVDKPARRGSVSSTLFRKGSAGSLPVRAFSRLRLGRIRGPSQIKKLWLEINEVYATVLTHGPHLVEEKIVTRASMTNGILGPWNARRVKSATLHANFQVATVTEGMRRVESILLWQQRLIVAIRRDLLEQRKSLQRADFVISQAYLQNLESQQIRR